MRIEITHYKATSYSDEVIYLDEDLDCFNVDVKKHFSRFIIEDDEKSWITVLIGINNLHFAESLHQKGTIDIVKAKEVKLFTDFEEFKSYCQNVFLPKYQENDEEYTAYELIIEGSKVFFLDFFISTNEKVLYIEEKNSIEFEINKQEILNFELEKYYCNKEDFLALKTIIPESLRRDYNLDFIMKYTNGCSLFKITSNEYE